MINGFTNGSDLADRLTHVLQAVVDEPRGSLFAIYFSQSG
jgi:hypothetical protein